MVGGITGWLVSCCPTSTCHKVHAAMVVGNLLEWRTVALCCDISHANTPTPLSDPKWRLELASLGSARLGSHGFIICGEKYIRRKKEPQLYLNFVRSANLPVVILILILYSTTILWYFYILLYHFLLFQLPKGITFSTCAMRSQTGELGCLFCFMLFLPILEQGNDVNIISSLT